MLLPEIKPVIRNSEDRDGPYLHEFVLERQLPSRSTVRQENGLRSLSPAVFYLCVSLDNLLAVG